MRQPPRFGYSPARVTPRPSRRDVLKMGMLAAAGLSGLTSLSACAAVPKPAPPGTPQVRGGVYSHGATGGGLKDTLEPYFPVTNPDISRCLQLYEPLLRWNPGYEIEPVAESVTPNADNTSDPPAARRRGVPPRQDGDPDDVMHTWPPSPIREHRLRRHEWPASWS